MSFQQKKSCNFFYFYYNLILKYRLATKGEKHMYCKYCGAEIADDSAFCSKCGSAFDLQVQPTSGMVCPECGGGNVDIQVMQVNRGGATVTKTKGKIIQRKGHSLLSWLLFWWLWLIVALFDILLWIFLFRSVWLMVY